MCLKQYQRPQMHLKLDSSVILKATLDHKVRCAKIFHVTFCQLKPTIDVPVSETFCGKVESK